MHPSGMQHGTSRFKIEYKVKINAPTILDRLSALALISLQCAALLYSSSVVADRGFHRSPLTALTANGDEIQLYKESHALLVGASRYEKWGALPSIPGELDNLETALESHGFNVERLVDPDADHLKSGIEDFINEYGYEPDNRLLIFFSGHGHSEGSRGFLLPVDAPLPDQKKEFRRHALSMSRVMAWAREIESKHVLFVFDSCFSGSVFKAKSVPRESDRYIRQATDRPVRQFLTAGSAGELVPARSTFTPALVAAIQGEGDINQDGYVTGNELGVHISQLVPRYVDQTPQFGTIRDYSLGQGDFVFFTGDKQVAVEQEIPVEADTGELRAGPESTIQFQLAELPTEDLLDNALWDAASADDNEKSYERYLERFPDGVFAGIAQDRLSKLRRARREHEAQLAADQAARQAEQERLDRARSEAERQAALAEQQLRERERQAREQARLAEAQRAREQAQLQAAIEGEEALELPRDLRRTIQIALNEAGFDVGFADGLWGAKTRSGIQQWQASSALPETGYLNKSTFERLMSELSVEEVKQTSGARQLFEPEMVRIGGGSFRMGTKVGGNYNERPVRTVKVEAFEIGKYEVTFAQYDTFARATGKPLPKDSGWGRGSRPVINVNWDDAKDYIRWLNRNTAGGYRLPSEAEWEYAAQAGSQGDWSFSGDDSKLCKFGNGNGTGTHTCIDRFKNTAPAGSFLPNRNGLHDVHGNVWEWVEDCWHRNYKGAPRTAKAWIDSKRCGSRVLRGGSWYDGSFDLRGSKRNKASAGTRRRTIGFRVARSLSQ